MQRPTGHGSGCRVDFQGCDAHFFPDDGKEMKREKRCRGREGRGGDWRGWGWGDWQDPAQLRWPRFMELSSVCHGGGDRGGWGGCLSHLAPPKDGARGRLWIGGRAAFVKLVRVGGR